MSSVKERGTLLVQLGPHGREGLVRLARTASEEGGGTL